MRLVGYGEQDPPLSTKGVSQVRAAHEYLSHAVAQGSLRQPDLVFSSVLTRAMQSAAVTFNQTVHVADYVPETHFAAAPNCGSFPFSLHPASCALEPNVQLSHMQSGLVGGTCPAAPPTPEVVDLISWGFLGGKPEEYTACHPSSWTGFLEFLWTKTPARDLVLQQARDGRRRLIAVTTHGDFMDQFVLPRFWRHPKNAGIYKGVLRIRYSDHTPKGFEAPTFREMPLPEPVGFEHSAPQGLACIHNCHG